MSNDSLAKATPAVPPLYGLVLAGGKSTRMGTDKGLMNWHGKPQRYYLADLLAVQCEKVFISCRREQASTITAAGYQPLPDSVKPKAQFGAILSALTSHTGVAWLVIACDLPLITTPSLATLIAQRDPSKLATAYQNPETGLPEPLAAIWEPSAKAMLLKKFSEGIDCPRKSLIRSEGSVKLVPPSRENEVMNVNTPEAALVAKELIAAYAAN